MAALKVEEDLELNEDEKQPPGRGADKRAFSQRASLTGMADERMAKSQAREAEGKKAEEKKDKRPPMGETSEAAAPSKGKGKGKTKDEKASSKKDAVSKKKTDADFRPGQQRVLVTLLKLD